jgi:hypothetical protein
VIEWLNDNSGAVQAIAVVVLAAVTAVYAILTWLVAGAARRQADASAEMAQEMRGSREDGSRPVLDIRSIEQSELGTGPEAMVQAERQLRGEVVWCKLRNIGKGPALNVGGWVVAHGDAAQGEMDEEKLLGTLGVDNETEYEPFEVIKAQDNFVQVRYQDVHGRRFFSRRRVELDESGPRSRLGPLSTGEEHFP